uniref:SAM domain-containing protein n=1 Tax=Arcella intermedia TaxID=1963864 RepID=A0A6B2L3J4_9EUKA
MKEKIGTEVETLKQGIDSNSKTTKNLANWIKDNLGAKNEKTTEFITSEITRQLQIQEKKLREEQKEREAALWEIFNAKSAKQEQLWAEQLEKFEKEREESKEREAALWTVFKQKFNAQEQAFEDFMQNMADERTEASISQSNYKKEITNEFKRFQDFFLDVEKLKEKIEEERKTLEESNRQIKSSYEDLMVEARRRPEAEAEMFQRLTVKLDNELTLLTNERHKMEELWKEKKKELEQPTKPAPLPEPSFQPPKPAQPKRSLTASSNSTDQDKKVEGRQAVAEWLAENGLAEYYQKFISCGYESIEIISLIDDAELSAINIPKPGHRKALLLACQKLRENNKSLQNKESGPPQVESAPPPLPSFPTPTSPAPAPVATPSPAPVTTPAPTPFMSPEPKAPQVSQETPKSTSLISPTAGSRKISVISAPVPPPRQLPSTPFADSESSDTVYSDSEEDIFANK